MSSLNLLDLFPPMWSKDIKPEDRPKAEALLNVVTKSTANLGDVVKLADALGLRLSLIASSKPDEKEETTK